MLYCTGSEMLYCTGSEMLYYTLVCPFYTQQNKLVKYYKAHFIKNDFEEPFGSFKLNYLNRTSRIGVMK